jgi:hypothetical protein
VAVLFKKKIDEWLYCLRKKMVGSLFSLLILSVLTVAASDCEIVVDIWKNHFNKDTDVDPSNPFGCCKLIDNEFQSSSGINGVYCKSHEGTANVTHIFWGSQSLSGSIPASIGDLVNLEIL